MKYALGAIAAAVVALFFVYDKHEATTTPIPQSMATPTATAQQQPAPVITTPAPVVSMSARIDALMRSPRPVDALEAFKILDACMHQKENCGNISPGQLTARRQALYRAAEAGVHGAAMLVASQGPDDYGLHTVNNTDPVFKEWESHVHRAIEAGVRTGDRFSLTTMAQWAEMPTDGSTPNPARALMYWTAVSMRSGPAYAQEIERRAKELPPDQASRAIADGKQLALAFKPEGEQQ